MNGCIQDYRQCLCALVHNTAVPAAVPVVPVVADSAFNTIFLTPHLERLEQSATMPNLPSPILDRT